MNLFLGKIPWHVRNNLWSSRALECDGTSGNVSELDSHIYNSERIRLREIKFDAFPWCHMVSCVTLNVYARHSAHLGWLTRSLRELNSLKQLYEVSWCQISSLMIPDVFTSLQTCPGSFSQTCFFKISGRFIVFSSEESASHPLSLCKRECLKYNCNTLPHAKRRCHAYTWAGA